MTQALCDGGQSELTGRIHTVDGLCAGHAGVRLVAEYAVDVDNVTVDASGFHRFDRFPGANAQTDQVGVEHHAEISNIVIVQQHRLAKRGEWIHQQWFDGNPSNALFTSQLQHY